MQERASISRDVFRALTVRPVRSEERARWRQLMSAHHYLGFGRIVGQSLWYVATVEEQWVALLGWGAAALKCSPRDAWIGWPPALKFRRLHLVANNVRFLILPEWHSPNVASRILALNCQRLSPDWERYYDHPLWLAETFVDGAQFRGTCYRAAGWHVLGTTRGFAKRGPGYVAHGQPKLILVRPLHPEARSRLRAPFLSPYPSPRKENRFMVDLNRLPLEGDDGLIDLLRTLVDPRQRRGVRHPLVTVVAISVCAALSGARSFNAIAEWAKDLSRDTLKRFGSRRWKPPSEPTLRRVLQKIDADALDAEIGPWLLRQHGARIQGLSVDGKTLRGAHDAGHPAPHLLSALLHQEGLVVAQRAVGEKTNEIPELPRLLAPLPLEGAVITADALHTQEATARYVVEEKKADYLFTVKENQPTLKQDIADLHLEAFPPQHTTTDKGHGRLEVRHIWASAELVGYLDFPYAAQVFALQRDTTELASGKFRTETVYGITSLRPEEASPARLLALNRAHGSIENRLHCVRDCAFDEDRCRIRRGAGARVMASLRNLAIGLLRLAGVVNIAQGLRACARNFRRALRLLGLALN